MENEIGRIKKSEQKEIVITKNEYKGKVGINIREYITSEKYTGWSKSGIRIPEELWNEFMKILNSLK